MEAWDHGIPYRQHEWSFKRDGFQMQLYPPDEHDLKGWVLEFNLLPGVHYRRGMVVRPIGSEHDYDEEFFFLGGRQILASTPADHPIKVYASSGIRVEPDLKRLPCQPYKTHTISMKPVAIFCAGFIPHYASIFDSNLSDYKEHAFAHGRLMALRSHYLNMGLYPLCPQLDLVQSITAYERTKWQDALRAAATIGFSEGLVVVLDDTLSKSWSEVYYSITPEENADKELPDTQDLVPFYLVESHDTPTEGIPSVFRYSERLRNPKIVGSIPYGIHRLADSSIDFISGSGEHEFGNPHRQALRRLAHRLWGAAFPSNARTPGHLQFMPPPCKIKDGSYVDGPYYVDGKPISLPFD